MKAGGPVRDIRRLSPLDFYFAALRSAASTTLFSSNAQVIGRTPPGVGEIQLATSYRAGSMSPHPAVYARFPAYRCYPSSSIGSEAATGRFG